ncbi:hypothetical protein EDF51_106134 [Curtobacterium sp. PhB25]|nr:hypothetical protein EDF51_106134 [Curtobacterium sp. PhB25]
MSPSRVWSVSRYGQRMIQLPAGWPPLFSFEWWSPFGTGLLSFTAAALIGATTATVAFRSHLLARRVAATADQQAKSAREDRYRDQLLRVVEPAVSSLVEYGNHVSEAQRVETAGELQLHATTLSRLFLVDAVADESDQEVTQAVVQAFHSLHKTPRWGTRVEVAGRLAGALARLIGRDYEQEEMLAYIRGSIEEVDGRARAREEAAAKARRAENAASADG